MSRAIRDLISWMADVSLSITKQGPILELYTSKLMVEIKTDLSHCHFIWMSQNSCSSNLLINWLLNWLFAKMEVNYSCVWKINPLQVIIFFSVYISQHKCNITQRYMTTYSLLWCERTLNLERTVNLTEVVFGRCGTKFELAFER